MASTQEIGTTDQAAGLRRLMGAPLSALCTVLSADGRDRKPALVARLAASMARRGHPVIVLSTRSPAADDGRPSLLDVARGKAALADACGTDDEGISHLRLGDTGCHYAAPLTNRASLDQAGPAWSADAQEVQGAQVAQVAQGEADASDDPQRIEAELSALLRQLAAGARLLVDAELDARGQLPLPLLADGEVVVQLSGSAGAIRDAYDMLRALKALGGRGTVSLLVTDADPVRARHVHANLFHAASRYLALPVRSITAPPAMCRPSSTGIRHV